jgi:hypothetical protein
MNLTPRRPQPGVTKGGSCIRGSALSVWLYLRNIAFKTNPPSKEFQVSRREIKQGTGIGSFRTIDDAVAALESLGLLVRHPVPGSNDGHYYELLTLDEYPTPAVSTQTVVTTLRQLADSLECTNALLTPAQINQWSILAYKARRLLSQAE